MDRRPDKLAYSIERRDRLSQPRGKRSAKRRGEWGSNTESLCLVTGDSILEAVLGEGLVGPETISRSML